MRTLTYKLAASGAVSVMDGKKKLSAIWDEVAPPPNARKQLRTGLERRHIQATAVIFGKSLCPAELNETLSQKKWVYQVLADNFKVLPLIYNMVIHDGLKIGDPLTLVQRFKAVLMKKGYQPPTEAKPGWYRSDDNATRKKTDVNKFWPGHDSKKDGLTEAGWRYLIKQPLSFIRALRPEISKLRDQCGVYNLLGRLNYPSLSEKSLAIITSVFNIPQGYYAGPHPNNFDQSSFLPFVLAYRQALLLDPQTLYNQADSVRDWIRDERCKIAPDTLWTTLVQRATTYKLNKIALDSLAMSEFKWRSPIADFVANAGLLVSPLTQGDQIVKEGVEMANCLKDSKRYVTESFSGKTQIFSIRGVAGRATVEFNRARLCEPWQRGQAEEQNGMIVSNPELLKAIATLDTRMALA